MSIVVEDEQFEDSLKDDESIGDFSKDEETSLEALDDLENSIENDVPEKFQGKELKDVVNSYTELEKELGRKNNEVGELRKLTDDFLKQQLDAPAAPKENQIDLDDLLENPNDVVTKAVDNNPRIAALEEQLRQAQVLEQKTGFESKHKDWDSVLKSEDFASWVTGSPVRQNMFQEANANYDYAVLDEVFSLYKDVRGVAKEQAENKAAVKRKKALKNTSTEKGSTGEVSKKVYRRADLIRLKQTDPNRYSEMNDEIMLAYAEGRVR